ncbi:MAG: S8 family serine peptidase, partial [Planctomycetes bacterium]|nr:S8 family serine peptidase [Planctomycetota bacterium]
MKPHRFKSLRWSRAALALFGSAALVHAQEPAGPIEPIQTPEVFRDAGPAPTAQPVDMRGQEGPLTIMEWPAEARPDEFYRYDKSGEELQSIPQEFLGNPYFLGFAKNLYRPPVGERVDPLLVQRLVQAQVDGEQIAQTWAFVMIEGRDTAEKRDRIASLGVKLLRYHPNNCYSARIPLDRLIELSEMPEVHWVGYPRTSQKMHFNLRAGIEQGWLWGEIPVWVNLYESDLGPASVKVAGPMPVEAEPGGILRDGNPEAAGYEWQTNSALLEQLKQLGFKPKRYYENIDAYEGTVDISRIDRIALLEKVQHVEWSPLLEAGHDRHIPQVGQDYQRESTRVLSNTIGIADSGFAQQLHIDIGVWGVGWSYWTGGCGSVWCDEAGEGYHGSHTLGTILGNGAGNSIYRGTSPYNARTSAQRLFAVKGYTYSAFQHYRNSYTDGGNVTSPRPFLSSHSWRSGGCGGTPQAALNWIGSESGARTTDDEVFQYNQLYVFCGGNEGDCAGGCGASGTMGIPSVAKNALTVGAVWDDVTSEGEVGVATCFSSNGPCGDGRWKPNVVAPGCNTTSVNGATSNGYSSKCGCSMATPMTAGVLSGAAEKYGWNWSSMARAWAMGTAVSWQDGAGSNLNRYGLGRISAVKAQEGGGSYPWVRSWAGSTITSETDTMDISVGSGCTRLVIVLTWDDPQSSSGASRAIVNDIDLWVDQEPFSAAGNAGEWASTSVVQSVEHEVINNPTAGNYRLKVYPYANSTT